MVSMFPLTGDSCSGSRFDPVDSSTRLVRVVRLSGVLAQHNLIKSIVYEVISVSRWCILQ